MSSYTRMVSWCIERPMHAALHLNGKTSRRCEFTDVHLNGIAYSRVSSSDSESARISLRLFHDSALPGANVCLGVVDTNIAAMLKLCSSDDNTQCEKLLISSSPPLTLLSSCKTRIERCNSGFERQADRHPVFALYGGCCCRCHGCRAGQEGRREDDTRTFFSHHEDSRYRHGIRVSGGKLPVVLEFPHFKAQSACSARG